MSLKKEFTSEDLEELQIYDPYEEERQLVKIQTDRHEYEISVVDLNKKPKHNCTLILVHGWGSNLLNYRFLLKYLQEYFRIIAYDLRGHGESDKTESDYDLQLYADELSCVIDHFKPNNIVLMGHSMGTTIVMNHLYLHPEIKAAILTSGSSNFREPFPRIVPLVISKIDEKVKDYLVEIAVSMLMTRGCPKEVLHIVREQNKRTPFHVYRKALLNTIFTWEKDEDLNKIRNPILILVGKKDLLTPVKDSKKLNEMLPKSRLVIIPGCGHGILMEKGKAVSKIVKEFIEYRIELEGIDSNSNV